MTRKQLVVVYAIVIFMMVWGLDLIAIIKLNRPITLPGVLSVFTVSQIIYVTTTLLLTRFLFRKYFLAKRYALLTASVIGLMLFFILLRYTLEEVIASALYGYHNYNTNVSFTYYALDNVYYALIYLVLGFLIFLLELISKAVFCGTGFAVVFGKKTYEGRCLVERRRVAGGE
jgi:hypothetical protein